MKTINNIAWNTSLFGGLLLALMGAFLPGHFFDIEEVVLSHSAIATLRLLMVSTGITSVAIAFFQKVITFMEEYQFREFVDIC